MGRLRPAAVAWAVGLDPSPAIAAHLPPLQRRRLRRQQRHLKPRLRLSRKRRRHRPQAGRPIRKLRKSPPRAPAAVASGVGSEGRRVPVRVHPLQRQRRPAVAIACNWPIAGRSPRLRLSGNKCRPRIANSPAFNRELRKSTLVASAHSTALRLGHMPASHRAPRSATP